MDRIGPTLSSLVPLHTNKADAMKKVSRSTVSRRQLDAIATQDPQAVIDSLTEKQKRFVEEFLKDLNGTQAVIRAGYNCTPDSARKMASQLRENPAVRIAIDALRKEREKNTDVTKDYVLRKIVRLIEKAEDAEQYQAALRGTELLGRHLSLFVDRTEISGPDGRAIEMEERVRKEVSEFNSSLAKLAAVKPAAISSK